VSDFLSRLIRRSSGEKSLVRPRIAPAFAGAAGVAGRGPAGEILRNPPERLPAVAPLPFEALRQRENPRRPGQSMNLQLPRMDARPREESRAPEDDAQPPRPREEGEERASGHTEVSLETALVVPASPFATRPEISGRPFVETPIVSPAETQNAPVFRVVREAATSRENPPAELVAPATPPGPPIFLARPPADRNRGLPVETPQTTKPGEPAIQVTIGKIEVRASLAPQKPAEKKTPSGAMSLEEYQRLRNRRSAG
jgi:hypothetical protein